jgi:hypothetical protein
VLAKPAKPVVEEVPPKALMVKPRRALPVEEQPAAPPLKAQPVEEPPAAPRAQPVAE